MTTIRGQIFVADDIRAEASGKLIVVGMYTNDITIPFDPFIVPQMNLMFAVEGHHSEHPPLLRLEVRLPGENPKTQDVPLTWSKITVPSGTPERLYWRIQYVMPLGIVTLRSGPIEGRIFVEDKIVETAQFWVRLQIPPAAIAGTAIQ